MVVVNRRGSGYLRRVIRDGVGYEERDEGRVEVSGVGKVVDEVCGMVVIGVGGYGVVIGGEVEIGDIFEVERMSGEEELMEMVRRKGMEWVGGWRGVYIIGEDGRRFIGFEFSLGMRGVMEVGGEEISILIGFENFGVIVGGRYKEVEIRYGDRRGREILRGILEGVGRVLRGVVRV